MRVPNRVDAGRTDVPAPAGRPAPIPAGHVLLGRFGAPHGVRGEVRLQSYTGEPLAIAGYGPLLALGGRRFTLTHARLLKEAMLVVRVAGVADRDAAAELTGLELSLPRAALPPVDEDEFYVADLVGMEAVLADGSPLGRVVDVPNYGGGELVEVRPVAGGETMLFPFLKAVVTAIDLAGRRLTIEPPDEVGPDRAEDEEPPEE